jgi:hypothetical protein
MARAGGIGFRGFTAEKNGGAGNQSAQFSNHETADVVMLTTGPGADARQ